MSSQESFLLGALAFLSTLLVVSCLSTEQPQNSVSERHPAAADGFRQWISTKQERLSRSPSLFEVDHVQQWKKHAKVGIRANSRIAHQLTSKANFMLQRRQEPSRNFAELSRDGRVKLFETPRKRLKRRQAIRPDPMEVTSDLACDQQGRQAVLGVDVSTFGPLAECVRETMRCIEQKRDQCLSLALTSGDLALYCPRLRGTQRGNCVESFLSNRCAAHARSCLRDCRGIVHSRSQFAEKCRARNKGRVCQHYTVFHEKRIATQNICVPQHCDTRTISDSLALHFGRKRKVQLSRSLPAQAMDDLVVCGGDTGEPIHTASANHAIDTFQQSSLANRNALQAPQHDVASPVSAGNEPAELYVITLIMPAIISLSVLL